MPDGFLSDEERDRVVDHAVPLVHAAVHAERRRPWWRPRAWVVCFLLGLVVFVAAFGIYVRSNSAQRAKDLATISALQDQVRGLGGTPVSGPAGAPGRTGATGATGPGPTAAQVRAGVRVVCSETPALCQSPVSVDQLRAAVRSCMASGQCPRAKNGTTGRTGSAGPAPTSTQLVAAVAAYCSDQSDHCRGSTGPAGKDGTDGAPGPSGATGPPGPSGAPGRDGRDGTDGADGTDAPTITAIDCDGPVLTDGLTFTYHFSDGAAITVTCTSGGN